MGLTTTDLHTMPLPRMLFMLNELAAMNSPDEDDGVRDATQADIRDYLM